MTPSELRQRFPRASESFIRENSVPDADVPEGDIVLQVRDFTRRIKLTSYPTTVAKSRVVLECTLNGDPMSKARPRFNTHSGHAYTPISTKTAEHAIRLAAALEFKQERNDFCGFGVRIFFYVKNAMRKDIDNMTKLVFDGLTGLVWGDDSQVKELMAWIDEEPIAPRTELIVYRIPWGHRRFFICQRCGKQLVSHPSWEIIGRKFCSRTCSSASMRKRIDLTCAGCGRPFQRTPYKIRCKRSYCSPECVSNFILKMDKPALKNTHPPKSKSNTHEEKDHIQNE